MSAFSYIHTRPLHVAALACAGGLLALSCTLPSGSAHAVTAAEKQAEADAVYAQIDSLQTNLNKAMAKYDRAQASHDEAVKKSKEAQQSIKEETERIKTLQDEISAYAVGMYKQGGSESYLNVLLDTESFDDFITTWDTCSTITKQGTTLLDEAKASRAKLEKAQKTYESQSKRAQSEMDAAADTQAEIEATQAALREEAQKLSAEAAKLQVEEELAAEAARQAEEARKQREAELAAAAAAAEEAARAQAEQQAADAEAQADGDGGEADADGDGNGDGDADGDGLQAASVEEAVVEPVVVGSGYFTNPCPTASSSSGFGYRDFDNSFHKGLDMAAPEGTPYYAADSGTVMYATNDGGYNGGAGNWVVISHGNGIVTKYMHSSATFVQPGDYVERGQNIGLVGNTGQSFGAHLHFQVEIDGVAVNPLNYI